MNLDFHKVGYTNFHPLSKFNKSCGIIIIIREYIFIQNNNHSNISNCCSMDIFLKKNYISYIITAFYRSPNGNIYLFLTEFEKKIIRQIP